MAQPDNDASALVATVGEGGKNSTVSVPLLCSSSMFSFKYETVASQVLFKIYIMIDFFYLVN